MQGVYGPAAPPMKKYLDLLQSETRDRHLWIFNVPDYSDTLIPAGLKLFDEAARLADNDAARKLIDKERLSLEYLSLLRERDYSVRDGLYQPANLAALQAHATQFLARVKSHGIQSLHEGQALDRDESYYQRLARYRVVTLENAAWRVDVAPELNGRVIRLFDKAAGRETLRKAPPADGGYPNTGGLFPALYPDQHGKPRDLTWSLESSSATELTLRAAADDGLNLRCAYRLATDGLHINAELENTSAEAKPVALQIRAELEPIDIDAARITFKSVAGAQVDRRFIQPGEIPNGRETYFAGELPAGTWNLAPAGVANHFNGVDRAVVTWSAKSRPLATLLLWSPEKVLAPGASLSLTSAYGR
jgi:hypothetical protein